MASNSSSGVVRRKRRPLAPLLRYYPDGTWSLMFPLRACSNKKEEAVRLGVKLSVSLAESMFLLCDDIHTMLCFCLKLWRVAEEHRYNNDNHDCPVVERLLRAMHYVYSKDIKPKNRVFQNGGKSVQWELIRTTYMDFADGIILLHRLVFFLTKHSSFDDRLLSQYKQVLKKLEGKLRSAEDVSKANGFARETIESSIFYLWKSLFDEEATPKVIKNRIITDLFQPFLDESHTKIPIHSPGRGFAKQELKEEVVRLGVELSLYVAQSMFFLCDDTHSMLRFCFKLWRDAIRYANRNWNRDSPVAERLLLVIHYVYSKDIKPKNGLCQNGGRLVRWRLIRTTWENFSNGIQGMDDLVLILRGEGSCLNGREFTSGIEEALKKVEEKLRRAKAVSELNGFAREAMESNILDLWQSVYDKEAKEAKQTLKVIKNGILSDLWNELALPP